VKLPINLDESGDSQQKLFILGTQKHFIELKDKTVLMIQGTEMTFEEFIE